jgi:hypothetical protein
MDKPPQPTPKMQRFHSLLERLRDGCFVTEFRADIDPPLVEWHTEYLQSINEIKSLILEIQDTLHLIPIDKALLFDLICVHKSLDK